MSMALGHFALGTSGTMIVFHMLPLHIRLRMRMAQTFIVILGGLWAVLPDIAKFTKYLQYLNDKYWTGFGLFQPTRFHDLTGYINKLKAFHDSPWANACFFHRYLDIVDKNDSLVVSGVLIFTMLLVATLLLLRDLRERRRSGT